MQNDANIQRMTQALNVMTEEIDKYNKLDQAHQTILKKMFLLDVIANKLYVAFETSGVTHHDILSKPIVTNIAPILAMLATLNHDEDEIVKENAIACAAKIQDVFSLASTELKSDGYSLINMERFCAEFTFEHYATIFNILDCSTALERPMSEHQLSSVFFYFSDEFRRYLKVMIRYIIMEHRNYLTKELYAGMKNDDAKEQAYESFERNKYKIIALMEKELKGYDQFIQNKITKRDPKFNITKKKIKKGIAGKLFGKETITKKKTPIKAELVPTSSPNFRQIEHKNTLLIQKLERVYSGDVFNYKNIASHLDTIIGDQGAFDDTIRKFADIINQNEDQDLHSQIARQYAGMEANLRSPILQEFILLALFYSTITYDIFDLQQYCASIEYKTEFLVEVISDLAENIPKHIAYMFMEKAEARLMKQILHQYADILIGLSADAFEKPIQAGLTHLKELQKHDDWIGTVKNMYFTLRENRNANLAEGDFAIKQLRDGMDSKIDELCKFMK